MAGILFTLQAHSGADITEEAVGVELGEARLTPVERATLLPAVTDAARRLVDALGVPCTVSVSARDRLAERGELTTIAVSVTSAATIEAPAGPPAPVEAPVEAEPETEEV